MGSAEADAEQCRDTPSSAPRCGSRRRGTAAPVRGDCCALSGLLGLIVSLTQGGVTARKTRGHLPWADMLRPLRGTPLRILGVGFRCTWPFAPRTSAFSRSEKPRTCQPCSVKMLNGVALRGFRSYATDSGALRPRLWLYWPSGPDHAGSPDALNAP